MEAGSWGAIQGAKRAKITKITTRTTPVAASGLWRAIVAIRLRNGMAAGDIEGVEFCSEYFCLKRLMCAWQDADFRSLAGVPPSPLPFERLAGRGVCKNGLQNPEGKELGGQNLENKLLMTVLAPAIPVASALTMMG